MHGAHIIRLYELFRRQKRATKFSRRQLKLKLRLASVPWHCDPLTLDRVLRHRRSYSNARQSPGGILAAIILYVRLFANQGKMS